MKLATPIRLAVLFVALLAVALLAVAEQAVAQDSTRRPDSPWKKHTVFNGFHTNSAVAADFTQNGKMDIVASCGGYVRLFVAPRWTEVKLYAGGKPNWNCIHSEVMDVDGDGDPDFIGSNAERGVFWLECPENAEVDKWVYHNIDNEIQGIHCTLKADVDQDGKLDLLANNFKETGAAPYSLTWLKIPANPREAKNWDRHVFADGDAYGGNHYFGFGDVDNDGRPDVSVGAKGQPFERGNWFAWWKNPSDPTKPWKKEVIAENQIGATNIIPADVNGDDSTDFIASRGHGKGVLWFEGPNWKKHEIDETLDGPHCLQVADLDGDGDMDAATCAKIDKLAVWYENDGKGNFKTHVVGRNQASYDIRAIDMDGDKDLDLLIGGQASHNVVWYENPLN